MKTTSTLYKELREQEESWYEVEVLQGSKTYGLGKAKSVKIFPKIIADDKKAPSSGGVCSAQCELVLTESSGNWPRMAEFTVRVRLNSEDGTQQSEWLDLGTYYTDERDDDTFGNLSITAYDGMLFTEQYWTDKVPSELLPASWPITSKAFCDMLEAAGLIEIDSRTVLDDTVAFIGLDTTSTIRDKLKDIAAVHGGNWHVTTDGKLRLVPFANMVDGSAAIAGIAIAGVSVVGDGTISIDSGADYTLLGMAVKTFNSSPALQPVSAVAIESPNGTVATAGTSTGYTLKGDCDFASTAGIAELCLEKTRGYIYKPFEAAGAKLDPAAEIGDLVIINGKSYQMMSIEWTLGKHPRAKISAPFEQEVDHEFTIVSKGTKTYRKSVAELNAYKEIVTAEFETTATEINARVTKTGGENKAQSFSWSFDETGHYWYANGDQSPIVQIIASGVKVRGEVNATSGYIGNGSYGFTIGDSSIANGMTSYSDTQHNGVYIGTDGISLGGGKFKVDSAGNMSGSTGTFTGNVYASNIQYGATGGYLSGAGISGAGNFGTGYFTSGVGTSLGYANFSNSVFNDLDTAPFMRARSITGTDSISGGILNVWSDNSNAYVNTRLHTHTFTVDDDGDIHIGAADWDGGDHPFNVADTRVYKEAVSAAAASVTITSLTAGRPTYDSSDNTYTIPLSASASNGATRTSSTSITASDAYNAGVSDGRVGYTKGTFASTYVVRQGTQNSYSRYGLIYRKTGTGTYEQITTALYDGGSGDYYYIKTS